MTTNTTFFDDVTVEDAERFLDHVRPLGVDGMTVASAFRYPDAPEPASFASGQLTSIRE